MQGSITGRLSEKNSISGIQFCIEVLLASRFAVRERFGSAKGSWENYIMARAFRDCSFSCIIRDLIALDSLVSRDPPDINRAAGELAFDAADDNQEQIDEIMARRRFKRSQSLYTSLI